MAILTTDLSAYFERDRSIAFSGKALLIALLRGKFMQPDIAYIASLIGDKTRASMLTALMSGKALTATELATLADISPQTASSHLNKLVAGQLLLVRKQGRHKYFQLKDQQIAQLLETLLSMSQKVALSAPVTGPSDHRLRKARICYDHLAGEISVNLYAVMLEREWICERDDQVTMTDSGAAFFLSQQLDIQQLPKSKRVMCRTCLDWSERRTHLAGRLGQWILADIFQKGWATKDLDSRIIQFSERGLISFSKKYGL